MNNPVSGYLSRETLTTALRAITTDLETLANGAAIQRHMIAAARADQNGRDEAAENGEERQRLEVLQ